MHNDEQFALTNASPPDPIRASSLQITHPDSYSHDSTHPNQYHFHPHRKHSNTQNVSPYGATGYHHLPAMSPSIVPLMPHLDHSSTRLYGLTPLTLTISRILALNQLHRRPRQLNHRSHSVTSFGHCVRTPSYHSASMPKWTL